MPHPQRKPEGGGKSNKELGGIDRSDNAARLRASQTHQRGGCHRTPATPAGGINKTTTYPQHGQKHRVVRLFHWRGRRRTPGKLRYKHHTQHTEDTGGDWRCYSRGHVAEQGGTKKRTDRAGYTKAKHHAPINVAKFPVGHSRGEGGTQFSSVDYRARLRRSESSENNEDGTGGDAKTHAEGSVDKFGRSTRHRNEE